MTWAPSPERRIAMCRALILIRKTVGDTLGFALCPNPIWDMLLDLYLAHHEARDVYVWPLCVAANVPFSTAYRKIGDLERRGLLLRVGSKRDRRRIGLRMTSQGLAVVSSMLDQINVIHDDSGTACARRK